jgi:hypothetical protein
VDKIILVFRIEMSGRSFPLEAKRSKGKALSGAALSEAEEPFARIGDYRR